ncbi:hypothetical protein [Arthrobacter crystallopoietes]|uniref:Uncharacterized protein n=1 Tax=Crystallibacter crystallopoietes TaxID=37928 RepID=A0A1H1DBD3_9MICC|nr:hypothetical protein [Arthrobacter crystallopoietes]AUI50376.1 hypothetical protein AC20117_05615 [Arthrobacter crystallopoietes]SDQ73841.1 hypothetical protein SAMN04489742_2362 [Arthrobacter crystallopoietes]
MAPHSNSTGAQPGEPEEAPLDLHAALRLVNDAETKAREELQGNEAGVYLIWAFAWLIGYGAMHAARFGWLPLSAGASLTVFGITILAALASTVFIVTRQRRGIRGHSSFVGAMYGGAWALGFMVMGTLSGVVGSAVDDFWLTGMIINGIALLIVGLMYMVGGAMFNDKSQAMLGIWFLVVNIVALLAGPANFVTVCFILGPLGFFAGAVAETLRRRRLRNRGRV